MSFLLKPYYMLLTFLIVAYAGITLLTPPDPASLERFSISETTLRLLSLTIIIPLIVIWSIAFWGFVTLRDYTLGIKNKGEGIHLHKIANGFMILSIGMPVSAIVGGWLSYLTRINDPMVPGVTIFRNYLTIVVFIVAFTLIAKGARALLSYIKREPSDRIYTLIIITIIVLAVVYSYFALNNPFKTTPSDITSRALYYLNDVQILFTIVLPYIYVWFAGFRSAYYINRFKNQVNGIIYKGALKFLALGVTFIVIASIATQFLAAATPTVLNFQLVPLLFLLYIVLGVISLRYIFMALGAKRLKRIEEV